MQGGSLLFALLRPDSHRPPRLVPVRHQSLVLPLPLRPLLPAELPLGRDEHAQLSSIDTFVSTEMLNAAMRSRTFPRVMPRISAARDWFPPVSRRTRVNRNRS